MKKKRFLRVLMLACVLLCATALHAQEPYAVLSNDNTVLTFYYDNQKAERGGMSVGPFKYSSSVDWGNQRSTITSVVFDASFADCTSLTSTANWFYGLSKLNAINGIENLMTDNVTDMSSMFSGCSGLTSLDVSGFKTDNVTNMYGMFSGCSGLTSLDVSGFKTDNVTYMISMFSGCSGLTSLDVSGFNTDKVTSMFGMFQKCSKLTSLDVSGFKTDKVTNMIQMFYGCSSLTNLDVSGFNTDNVTRMDLMFQNCEGLTSLDVSSFNTENVTDMRQMFYGCSGLTSLDVSGFKTDNVEMMFYMFAGCSSLTSLDISGFKTDKVTYMYSMFSDCAGLSTIYAGDGWTTDNVTSGGEMFINCTKLVGGQGTVYDENHTNYTYARIDGGAENPGYFTYKSVDTEPVTPAYNDGDIFTADAGNGFILRYTVISAAEKTCMLGIRETLEGENDPTAFADGNCGNGKGMCGISAFLKIPAEVNGYKVTEIARRALAFSYITGIGIPSTVTKICDQAFYGTHISELTIPASVTEIGQTIAASNNLQHVVVAEGNPVYDSRQDCNAIIETATNTLVFGCKNTVILEGIEAIGLFAFMAGNSDYGPVEVHIPKTVTRIEGNPFHYFLGNAERITVDENNPVYDSRNNCNAIIHTATGELVTGCKTTVIPENVTRIGTYAFGGLGSKLGTIHFPQSVKSIGKAAFSKTTLNELILPDKLESIEEFAFQQKSIKEVVIPATVKNIGEEAFFWCSNLQKVTVMSPKPIVLGAHAFTNRGYTLDETLTLYVPAGTKALYEAADGWKEFPNIVEMDGPTAISTVTNGMKTNGTVYNLSGQRVEKPAKGIFIKNGKKFVVK